METPNDDIIPLVHAYFSFSFSSLYLPSSSVGLSFIIEDSNNDNIHIVEELLDDEVNTQEIIFLLKVRQVAQEMKPSSSMPQVKRIFIRRDR